MNGELQNNIVANYGENLWLRFLALSEEIEKVIEYSFKNKEYLLQSLLVRAENIDKTSFETFEFIGDAILNLIISEYLVSTLKLKTPNILTKLRSLLTKNSQLATIAENLPIKDLEGLFETELTEKHLSDSFESLIGAIFLDMNYDTEKIKPLILNLLGIEKTNFADLLLEENLKDKKSQLNEWIQKTYNGDVIIKYPYINEGLQHKPKFYVGLELISKNDEIIHEEEKIGPFSKLKDGEIAIADRFLKKMS